MKFNNADEEKEYYLPFVEMLREYNNKGIPIYINGLSMPIEDIARTCAITERGSYMADYVIDDNQKLVEVRFDRISE